jgi:two-component system response regulator FlrC
VLEERRFERVGGTRTLTADVRWIAATNRDLATMMREGTFREDLYHRLAVFPIRLPALRERRQDLLPLTEALLRRAAADLGRPPLRLSDAARALLSGAELRGNIRELKNVLERAAILCDGGVIDVEHIWLDPRATPAPAAANATLEQLERAAIERALADSGGNRRQAAERLGIGLRTLYDKVRPRLTAALRGHVQVLHVSLRFPHSRPRAPREKSRATRAARELH